MTDTTAVPHDPDDDPDDDPAALRARIAQLEARLARTEERLELVQAFTLTGIFERDAATMHGHWDRWMYEIWGLPQASEGQAPGYTETSQCVVWEGDGESRLLGSLGHAGTYRQRIRIRRPDGQERHLNTQWKVMPPTPERPAGRAIGINTDVTEVYDLANKAAALRAELDVALTVGGIGVWRQDLATMRVTPDVRGCELIGVPYQDSGMSLEEARARIHPDDVVHTAASAEHTLRTGETTDMQLRYPAPGGGWRHVLLRRALQRDPEGRPLGFVGVIMDVSARVESERRLQEAARRLDMAADAAQVGLWSAQADHPLPSWNARMYSLLGLDPVAGPLPLRKAIERCAHPDDRVRVLEESQRWWRGVPGAYEVEFRIVRPSDGQTRWLVLRGRIEAESDDRPRRSEGVALDTTAHQTALRQLRETVERMSLTTRAVGLGTWSSDVTRDNVLWDAQMFRLRGVDSAARTVARDERRAFVHPEDRDAVILAQNDWIRDGETWRDVFRVVWPDGQVRWITSHSVPLLDERGRIEGRIGVNWDSTDVHLASQARRDRELAVAESLAKSQAMSRISHELRTPLNAILGFTQLLRLAEGDPDDPVRRDQWLALVEDAARHLLVLIDDVLDLTRAELNGLKLEATAVRCDDILDAALALVLDGAERQGLKLRRETVEGTVKADPVRLRQVLLNLLSNAIKYNRSGGEVRIGAQVLGDEVEIYVADTGHGIAPERLQQAFQPFNRLGAEATGIEGSGIGLAVAKALVEAMGGRIEARSEPGIGSRFSLRLPRADDSPRSAAAQRDGPAESATEGMVLYIEDNEVNALLVREMLALRPGVLLEIAVDGASGLELARELARNTAPSLVLVDMQLPDMTGHDVLRRLRSDPATAALRCVALSANATPADIDAALAAGFAEYWTKPIDWQPLLAGIDRLLGGPAASA